MNAKEVEKKRREIAEGEAAAHYLNQELGTDYRVEPTDREPADVLFVSVSEEHPERMVQIVTIPHDYEVRTDNQNLARLNRDLAAQLKAKGVTHLSVGYTALEATPKTGMPKAQVEALAEYIAARPAPVTGEPTEIGYMELLEVDPELSIYLSNVVLFRDEQSAEVTVDSLGVATELPEDGSWIEEGIQLKIKKYGGAEAVKNLTLVIGVEALVDRQQANEFFAARGDRALPFREILINSVEGTIRLK
ncbi:MAG: hypothetical protein JWQ42_2710 [Edaphobacter sp.]|nr:hypothetical protein [Edaphobacter sp.]